MNDEEFVKTNRLEIFTLEEDKIDLVVSSELMVPVGENSFEKVTLSKVGRITNPAPSRQQMPYNCIFMEAKLQRRMLLHDFQQMKETTVLVNPMADKITRLNKERLEEITEA